MDATKPLVSIVMTNYNYEQFLPAAVESALAQTYEHVEVILVDDGSTDASLERVKPYANRIRILSQPNSGQASAFFAGFSASSGEIVCLLDADDLFERAKVARVVQELTAHPEASWIFDRLTPFHDGSDQGVVLSNSVALQNTWGVWDRRAEIKKARLPYIPTATSGLSFRRALLESIPPVPEVVRLKSDNYLKICSLAFSPGIMLQDSLTRQRIHSTNSYTHNRSSKALLKDQMALMTGIALYRKAPILEGLGARMVSRHLGQVLLTNTSDPVVKAELRAFLKEIPTTTLVNVLARASYFGLTAKLGRKR